jgi:nucleoside-diphosphate-sugar epimerase
MTRTAIIGSTSFLARYIITDLEKENHTLTLFSREKTNDSHLFVPFAYPTAVPDYSVFLDYDLIIFAAAGGVQSSKKYSLDEIYALNAFLPISLSNFLNENNYKGKFISFGSYFEIGGHNDLKPFLETEVVLSNFEVPNHYCLSKRLLTRFVNDSISEIKHYHIILPSIYGKNENSNRLIPYLIASLENQIKLELTAGTQTRQFLHVQDVSQFVMHICNQSIESGVYNLAPDTDNLVRDVVEIVFDHFNQDVSDVLGKIQRQDEAMQVLLLDNKKAKNTGWKPTIALKDGILDYFKEIKK